MLNDFALIVSEETVHSLSDGRIDGRVAVAVVSSGVAEIHVVPLADVAALAGSLPRVPAPDGQDSFLLDHEEELEILAAVEEHVRSEAVRRSFGPPPGFVPIESVIHHGLSVLIGEEGLDLRIGRKLSEKAGWKAGDKVGVAVASDGRTMCIFLAESGRDLVSSSQDLGVLEPASYLPVPHGYADRVASNWTECSYWVSDGRVFLDVSQFEVDLPAEEPSSGMEEDTQTSTQSLSSWLPAVLDSDTLHGAAASAAAVALLALAWRVAFGA